jgi:hypothetical protein
MGYCSRTDIEKIIAQALTSATSATPAGLNSTASLLNIGNTLDNNLITDSTVDSYIQLGDSEIDANLSELYKTPFVEKVDLDTVLYSAVNEYNDYIVLEEVYPLTQGDVVILIDGSIKETHTINEIISNTVFGTEYDIEYDFPAGSRVIRVSYPDPIRWVSARLSAANIYDKYFASESSPNTSEFGNSLREMARADLNNITNGTTILHGQQRIGRRFYNPNLVDQYGLPRGGAIDKGLKQIK